MRHCHFTICTVTALAGGILLWAASWGLADEKDGAWGTITGQVVLDAATVPERKPLEINKDQDHCLSKGPILSEEWIVNTKNKGVRWVFVWLAPQTADQKLAVHPSLEKIGPKQVSMDQPCCMFVPHALAIREGQEVEAKNSAPVPHNVHWTGHPLKNPGGNQILPSKQSLVISGLKSDKYPVQISCDIHGWMKAWIRVFDHPYFALTDEDGKFQIKLAPAGNYRLLLWHEAGGFGPGGREGIPITVKGGGTTDAGKIKLKLQ